VSRSENDLLEVVVGEDVRAYRLHNQRVDVSSKDEERRFWKIVVCDGQNGDSVNQIPVFDNKIETDCLEGSAFASLVMGKQGWLWDCMWIFVI